MNAMTLKGLSMILAVWKDPPSNCVAYTGIISSIEVVLPGAHIQFFAGGVYTLAGPTFIISLFLDRLVVKKKIAIRMLFFAVCCFCYRF